MRRLALAALVLSAGGCVTRSADLVQPSTFDVVVRSIDGDTTLPTQAAPHPVDLARTEEVLSVDVVARRGDGSIDTTYSGFARVSLHPGTVVGIDSDGAVGRNVLLHGGQALAQQIRVTGAHGPTRVWIEDLGYVPAPPDKPPACANGIDDNGNGLIDYPGDPGCAFPNDDSEDGGSYATGISGPVWFALPRLADVQGLGAATPYSEEQIEAMTDAPANVVVTRISTDGFYVSDTTETRGYGHLYAFNFSAPAGLRVCDRLTRLAGTPSEFYGFTELGFPSWETEFWDSTKGPCPVPEPFVIAPGAFSDVALEKYESGLVRVKDQLVVAAKLGPGSPTGACLTPPASSTSGSTLPATGCTFDPGATNCDLNGDGKIDYTTKNGPEANCSNNCDATLDCSEWSQYLSQHTFRVRVGPDDTVLVRADTVSGFDAPSMRGKALAAFTGTLRNFSGGNLKWTIEARCTDDVVWCPVVAGGAGGTQDPACLASPPAPASSQKACVRDRLIDDPGTN